MRSQPVGTFFNGLECHLEAWQSKRGNCSSTPLLFVPIAVRRWKKGSSNRPSQVTRRADHQDPRPDRWDVQASRLPRDWGNVADCKAGKGLIDRMPATSLLNADKGYDSDAIRRHVRQRGAFANIPPKANRTWKNCLSPHLTGTETPLSACSAGSRTSAASPPDTIDWLQTS